MGRSTNISWTRSTRNFWSGCTKVGPGCDGCYAEASSRRMRGVSEITLQANNWGPGAPRVPHLDGAERDLLKWNANCLRERETGNVKKRPNEELWQHPGFWPVFINSYSDTFDNEVPNHWRGRLLDTIEKCPALTFQLVTKRVGNVLKMLDGRWDKGAPRNVWLLITVVNQEELDRDGPKLLDIAERLDFSVVGLSIEPQIGEVDATAFLGTAGAIGQTVWGISGGESGQPGHPARPFVLGWGKRLARDFSHFEQPFFFKQLGNAPTNREGQPHPVTGKGVDMAEWPAELRVQQFPREGLEWK